MKIHLYKNTPFGIERVNDRPLTIEEARAVLKGNPSLTARDAESAAYEVLHMPIDWQDEEPTCQAKQAALTAYQAALPLPFTFAELWHRLGFSSEVYP